MSTEPHYFQRQSRFRRIPLQRGSRDRIGRNCFGVGNHGMRGIAPALEGVPCHSRPSFGIGKSTTISRCRHLDICTSREQSRSLFTLSIDNTAFQSKKFKTKLARKRSSSGTQHMSCQLQNAVIPHLFALENCKDNVMLQNNQLVLHLSLLGTVGIKTSFPSPSAARHHQLSSSSPPLSWPAA